MRRWFAPVPVLVCLLGIGGCGLFHEVHKTSYETVQADPHHDTPLAESEHRKAVELLTHCSGCCSPDLCKAEEHLQKALIADVTLGPAHNTLGALYLRQQKFYLAAWEFEYASKLMPDKTEPFYNLGLVYEQAERLDRAIEYYTIAFSMAPRNPSILESLVRARLRNGDKVADVRHLLEEIVLYETRPDWICWARDQMGLKGNIASTAAVPMLPAQEFGPTPWRPSPVPPPPAGGPPDAPTGGSSGAPQLILPRRIATPDDARPLSLRSPDSSDSKAWPRSEPLTIRDKTERMLQPTAGTNASLLDSSTSSPSGSSPAAADSTGLRSTRSEDVGNTGHATLGGPIPAGLSDEGGNPQ